MPLPFLLANIISATGAVVSLAMLFLVLWQAARRRANLLMALYMGTVIAWSVCGLMVRLSLLAGQDPSVYFRGVLDGIALNSIALFALAAHYAGRYRAAPAIAACGAVYFLVVVPTAFPTELANRLGETAQGIYYYRFDSFGAFNFGLVAAYYAAALLILWKFRREKTGRLLPGAVAVVAGVLTALAPALSQYSLALLGASLSSILFARAILYDNLFYPLAELNRQLAENERRLRSVITGAPIVLFVLDSKGIFTLIEGRGLEALGVKPGDIIGRSVYETNRDLPQVIRAFEKALAGETATSASEVGGLSFEARYSPIRSEQGEIVGVIGVSTDVTERRRSEAALSRYVAQLELLQRADIELTHRLDFDYVLSMALDLALRLSYAEAGLIALTEGEEMRVAQVIGQYPESVVGYRLPLEEGIIGRAMRQRQAVLVPDVSRDPDYRAFNPDTRAEMAAPLISQDRLIGVINLETSQPERFTEERFEFIKLLAGRVAAALDNARLYHTSKAQLDELRTLYEKVSALEQMKTDMIRIAAHDLRNPIGIVGGYLLLIQEEFGEQLSERGRDYFDTIQRALARMESITRDILSLQRIEEAGGQAGAVDMQALVEQVYREHHEQASRKTQQFELHLAATPVIVRGDEAQLHEAAANLVGNAIKYTPEGGCVRVRLVREDSRAVFEVEDTGYGVPDDQQARLFQPFFRAESDETKEIEGTGLGLHLVKNIVQRHRGEMRFHSVYGKGSTFGFTLPLV